MYCEDIQPGDPTGRLRPDYLRLFAQTPAAILEKYAIEVGEQTMRVRVAVRNARYRKG